MARGGTLGRPERSQRSASGINRSQSLSRGNTLDQFYGGNFMRLTPVDSAPSVAHSSKLPRRQESLTVPNATSAANQSTPSSMRKTNSFCSKADFYQHALMVSYNHCSDCFVASQAVYIVFFFDKTSKHKR